MLLFYIIICIMLFICCSLVTAEQDVQLSISENLILSLIITLFWPIMLLLITIFLVVGHIRKVMNKSNNDNETETFIENEDE